jgi:hypothetical protein
MAQSAKRPDTVRADMATLLRWIANTGNHGTHGFAVVDKRAARLWVFDQHMTQVGDAPVLLGLARGDDSVPGIGERPLHDIQDHERTTPAGRFVLEPGRNLSGEDILWVDYTAAVSLHRVRPKVAAERRLQRLASATANDNRISYGCINVPTAFYDRVVLRTLGRGAVIYILPEVRSMTTVFSIPADAHATSVIARAH